MTISELKGKLVTVYVSQNSYSLKGGLSSDAYCIEEVEGGWQVYYGEKGSRWELKFFANEAEACDCFLALAGKILE